MHGLESAMSMVEKGFLRNNVTIVKSGTENFKVNLKNINSFLIEPSADDKNFNAQTYAATESAAIAKLADEILANFEAGKHDDARASFDNTLSRCLACHRIIRKW
jgi:cytochrome c556